MANPYLATQLWSGPGPRGQQTIAVCFLVQQPVCQLLERVGPRPVVPAQRRLAVRDLGHGEQRVELQWRAAAAVRFIRRPPRPPSRAGGPAQQQAVGLGIVAVAPARQQSRGR